MLGMSDVSKHFEKHKPNELEISRRLGDLCKNSNRFIADLDEWAYFNGKYWEIDTANLNISKRAKGLVKELLELLNSGGLKLDENAENRLRNLGQFKNRESLIKDTAMEFPIKSKSEFDRDPMQLNCENGTINFTDFLRCPDKLNEFFKPHNSSDLLMKMTNVHYDPNADCPRWKKFIDEITENDKGLSRFIQKIMGYILTGLTNEERLFILYGKKTRNGKGTLVETMLHLLGTYALTAPPEVIGIKRSRDSTKPTPNLARLEGVRFVNISEPEDGYIMDSAYVKDITGGGRVTARFLYKNTLEYSPIFKIIINTNYVPIITDPTVFKSGRVDVIPFNRHFSEQEQDTKLKVFFKSDRNLPGIFNWCMAGLKLYADEGLERPLAVVNTTNELSRSVDTVALYASQSIVKQEGSKVRGEIVYDNYREWCANNEFKPKTKNELYKGLRDIGMLTHTSDMSNALKDYAIRPTGA